MFTKSNAVYPGHIERNRECAIKPLYQSKTELTENNTQNKAGNNVMLKIKGVCPSVYVSQNEHVHAQQRTFRYRAGTRKRRHKETRGHTAERHGSRTTQDGTRCV